MRMPVTMAHMPKRLPDELFRGSGSVDVGDAEPGPERAAPTPGRALVPGWSPAGRGIAPRLVIAGVFGALLLGFGMGRIAAMNAGSPGTPAQTVSPTVQTSEPGPTTSGPTSPMPTLVPHDGPVSTLSVLDASGLCLEGVTPQEPANLIDANPSTFWRCAGAGVGESIRFSIDPDSTVVGLRIVNGNTVWSGRYLDERRILSIRWEFSDGSWFVQGLAANDPMPQEVRFPPVTGVDEISLSIVDATVPGSTDPQDNAVSISSLDFLAPN